MAIKTTTHLNFRGAAREALEFYQSVFGGHLVAVTYAEAGAVQNPDEAGQVIWGQVVAENGFAVMAYDVPSALEWDPGVIPVFVSVRGDDEDELSRHWQGLSEGGTVMQPFGPSAWSKAYGMLKDRFGVTWVLDMVAQ